MESTFITIDKMADCINREYQSRSSDESAEVLASVTRRLAGCIEDPTQRAYFVDIACMSGLEVVLHP